MVSLQLPFISWVRLLCGLLGGVGGKGGVSGGEVTGDSGNIDANKGPGEGMFGMFSWNFIVVEVGGYVKGWCWGSAGDEMVHLSNVVVL